MLGTCLSSQISEKSGGDIEIYIEESIIYRRKDKMSLRFVIVRMNNYTDPSKPQAVVHLSFYG